MVFKNPLHLARSGFAKSFAHYPQSLVAATQSSSQNYPFSTLGNVYGLLNNKAQTSSTSHHGHSLNLGGSNNTGHGVKILDQSSTDGGLAAYYAAWAKHHNKVDEREWHQFQFAKRIGWKAPTTILESQIRSVEQDEPIRPGLQRAQTTTAVDDIKHQEVLQKVSVDDGLLVSPALSVATVTQSSSEDHTKRPTTSTGSEVSLQSPSTQATSVSTADVYTEQLTSLAEAQRYAEIPAVFESMLRDGVVPTASAYNALLLAAITLPRGKHQVVPKVLDVYGDMVRRRVSPDTSTYAILVELLAARSLDVSAMKLELAGKQQRYSGFLLQSDETEAAILAEDDSLSIAVKVFDTSAAVSSNHVFSPETYRLLLTACAEAGRIEDMVRVYAHMESSSIIPPTEIFAPMIQAFAGTGDLKSAVECYEEYKTLAIAHDNGQKMIDRKDEQVYAAVVKAYLSCGKANGGLKFLGKIEDMLANNERLPAVRQAVSFQALYPHWLSKDMHSQAISHAMEKLGGKARIQGLSIVCLDAADKNLKDVALDTFALLKDQAYDIPSNVLSSVLALQLRNGNIEEAVHLFRSILAARPSTSFVESATIYASVLISNGFTGTAMSDVRRLFNNIRLSGVAAQDVTERIEESIEVICNKLIINPGSIDTLGAIETLKLMLDSNGALISSIAEPILANVGPQQVSQLRLDDIIFLTQVEASLLIGTFPTLDVAHTSRFAHLMDIALVNKATFDPTTSKLIEQVLEKIDQPGLVSRWVSRWQQQQQPDEPVVLQQQQPEATWDPYAATTDFKGSSIISEELEKSHGKAIVHLNEALAKFRNIRRAGRHPRYVTYAKLITAAAKENRLGLAQDVLAMAKQDVPFVVGSAVVRHGWMTILDSMVAACLTVGDRELASQVHNDMLTIGVAPSANTFGLYITTLKESTKTFDEATEAVKIFHRAKAEGVEPTSFLYNALIGKLGKARRIDDCLFFFTEMRNLGIRPTSVTYGTIVNALCRVSDDKFAEELFEEMESMPNYKPRPAPYNSLMQYFLTTKRDRSKVLTYYERMKQNNIKPTMHTYKLLIDSYATLEPVNMMAAEQLIDEIPKVLGSHPEAVHYASLIHAKGCVMHDTKSAKDLFDSIISDGKVTAQACLYQALFESLVANHQVDETEPLLQQMKSKGVAITPYIANSLIHGWALNGDVSKANQIFTSLGKENREPSTYEAMTRAWLSIGEHGQAMRVVGEMLKRGYPNAVVSKITDLVSPQSL